MNYVKAAISRDRFGGLTVEYKFDGVVVELYFNDGGETADFQSHLTSSQILRIAAAWTEDPVIVHLPYDVAEIYLPVEYYTA